MSSSAHNPEDLACRINAPICPGESCRESFKLMLEVLSSGHSTQEMIEAVVRRHGRVLNLHERRAA